MYFIKKRLQITPCRHVVKEHSGKRNIAELSISPQPWSRAEAADRSHIGLRTPWPPPLSSPAAGHPTHTALARPPACSPPTARRAVCQGRAPALFSRPGPVCTLVGPELLTPFPLPSAVQRTFRRGEERKMMMGVKLKSPKFAHVHLGWGSKLKCG